jgi:8-oxo-dGTP diphosphatase
MNQNYKSPLPVVRLILINDSGKVLVLRRKNTRFNEGDWCLPGGKVDYGQSLQEAVTTELKDETSLKLLSSTFLFYQDSLPQTKDDLHFINLYFRCEFSGDISLNDESSEYAWISEPELNNYNLVFGNNEALKKYWNQ